MKAKLLFAVFLIACSFATNAQKNIPKGSLLLGGDFSFSSNSANDNLSNFEKKSTGFTISPAVGIGVRDNLIIGLSLQYTFNRNKNNGGGGIYTNDSITSNGYGAAVYARKYKPLKNNFYLFLQGGMSGYYNDRSIKDVPGRIYYQRELTFTLSVTPGMSYAINSKLHVETGFNEILALGYTKDTQMDNAWSPGKYTTKSFRAYASLNNIGYQLYIGFRLLLQKKNKPIVSSKVG